MSIIAAIAAGIGGLVTIGSGIAKGIKESKKIDAETDLINQQKKLLTANNTVNQPQISPSAGAMIQGAGGGGYMGRSSSMTPYSLMAGKRG